MRLLVKFTNDTEKIYDCHQLLHIEAFQLLKNEALFRAVKVDTGIYGISWNDHLDLSKYELWTSGIELAEVG